MSEGITGGGRDVDQPKPSVLSAFSVALNDELDAVGFVPGHGRSTAMANLVGLSRTQTYRILKGMSAPTIECLSGLRNLGISLDRILDQISLVSPKTYDLYVNGDILPAIVQKGSAKVPPIAGLTPRGAAYELTVLRPGQVPGEGVIPVQALQFLGRDTLAIVEDDGPTLELLDHQMSDTFRVVTFDNATSLLERLSAPSGFQAFLIDWRLPDLAGGELVARIRSCTAAPIFILTGDLTASESIANAMDNANVHHVAKPADRLILTKRISHAIRNTAQ